jgi:hypothetical protein
MIPALLSISMNSMKKTETVPNSPFQNKKNSLKLEDK